MRRRPDRASMLRDIPDWGYVIITVMVLYAGIALQLHRLETHMEAGFGLAIDLRSCG
jgi:hypothetical protein